MRKKRRSAAGTIGLIIAVLLAVSVVGYLYLSDFYHADEEARSFLSAVAAEETHPETGTAEISAVDNEKDSSGDIEKDSVNKTAVPVAISEIDSGLFIDGPGTEHAMIFYPGGKVEYTAYLPLMNRLAKSGLDCFLTEMPVNLAILDRNRADDIIAAYSYDHWYLAGHSLGGAVAAMYAADQDGSAAKLEGLFLLAAYPTKQLPDIHVLELYGSEDGVLNREKTEKAAKYLPADAVVWEIPGGNHAQFGNYGFQDGDGQASIPAEIQQEITKEMILKQLEQTM